LGIGGGPGEEKDQKCRGYWQKSCVPVKMNGVLKGKVGGEPAEKRLTTSLNCPRVSNRALPGNPFEKKSSTYCEDIAGNVGQKCEKKQTLCEVKEQSELGKKGFHKKK